MNGDLAGGVGFVGAASLLVTRAIGHWYGRDTYLTVGTVRLASFPLALAICWARARRAFRP